MTLAWRDPVATISLWTLINDLDLVVVAPDGRSYYGNARSDHSYPMRDYRNNHEKVRIPAARPGVYSIIVTGVKVPEGPQTYAVTANGVAAEGQCPPGCTNDPCSGHGMCRGRSGICDCDAGYFAADCSQEALVMHDGDREEADVKIQSWQYFRVKTGHWTTRVRITMQRLDGLSDPDIYVQKDSLPHNTNYMLKDEGCDPCGRATNNLAFDLKHEGPATYYIGMPRGGAGGRGKCGVLQGFAGFGLRLFLRSLQNVAGFLVLRLLCGDGGFPCLAKTHGITVCGGIGASAGHGGCNPSVQGSAGRGVGNAQGVQGNRGCPRL